MLLHLLLTSTWLCPQRMLVTCELRVIRYLLDPNAIIENFLRQRRLRPRLYPIVHVSQSPPWTSTMHVPRVLLAMLSTHSTTLRCCPTLRWRLIKTVLSSSVSLLLSVVTKKVLRP